MKNQIDEGSFPWCDSCESYHKEDNPTCLKNPNNKQKFYHACVGEFVVSFWNSAKGEYDDYIIYFDSVDDLLKQFASLFAKKKPVNFLIQRFCAQNYWSSKPKPSERNFFLADRNVADRREGYQVNEEHLRGIWFVVQQYLLDKGLK